ncbi:membrane protein [Gordonia phage SpeedDemon]|nr:membrane protein [Gordonia phage SpeedDemon]
MNIRTRLAAVVASVVAATSIATGVAHASPDSPTVGDTITYEFISNSSKVDSFHWYDGWNESHTYPEDYDKHVVFKKSFTNSNGHTMWRVRKNIRSQSTYQITGSYISSYSGVSRPYVACKIYVNGVLTDSDSATGKYGTAYC